MADKIYSAALVELYDALGMNASAAAAYMDVSYSTITQAIRTEEASVRLDLKARAALKRYRAETEAQAIQATAPTQYLVSIPATKVEAFNKVSSAMGLELVAL